ncbi:hypothetical protein V6Z11_A13G027200 [Gossypium hirsutum]
MVAPNVVMSICVYTRDSILTAPDGIYTRFLFLSFGNYTNQIYPISISTIPYQHLGSCLRWIPLGEPKIIVWVHKEKQNKVKQVCSTVIKWINTSNHCLFA